MNSLRIKRLPHGNELTLPFYATPDSAGMDVQAAVETSIVLEPGERDLIPTGLIFEIPRGFEIQVRPRSGLALKHGISLVNSPGTIDSDYRGEIKIIMINHGKESFTIKRGERIAQLIIAPVIQLPILEVIDVSDTQRGIGGFGSTGV
mgnify:CR=1 FL=1|jgi:dUTP pyrophosphatase